MITPRFGRAPSSRCSLSSVIFHTHRRSAWLEYRYNDCVHDGTGSGSPSDCDGPYEQSDLSDHGTCRTRAASPYSCQLEHRATQLVHDLHPPKEKLQFLLAELHVLTLLVCYRSGCHLCIYLGSPCKTASQQRTNSLHIPTQDEHHCGHTICADWCSGRPEKGQASAHRSGVFQLV